MLVDTGIVEELFSPELGHFKNRLIKVDEFDFWKVGFLNLSEKGYCVPRIVKC